MLLNTIMTKYDDLKIVKMTIFIVIENNNFDL
jgi:hypothetical protein